MYVSVWSCVCMYACTHVFVWSCVYVCVCVYVCMYLYGRVYVCTYARMYVCVYVRMHVCICVCMYACTCVCQCSWNSPAINDTCHEGSYVSLKNKTFFFANTTTLKTHMTLRGRHLIRQPGSPTCEDGTRFYYINGSFSTENGTFSAEMCVFI
jgi:hypothetical protein